MFDSFTPLKIEDKKYLKEKHDYTNSNSKISYFQMIVAPITCYPKGVNFFPSSLKKLHIFAKTDNMISNSNFDLVLAYQSLNLKLNRANSRRHSEEAIPSATQFFK